MNGKGLKNVYDWPGFIDSNCNFLEEMREAMIEELNCLVDKYSGLEWNTKGTAKCIV